MNVDRNVKYRLGEIARSVTPDPDPFGRLMARRDRRSARVIASAAAVAVIAVSVAVPSIFKGEKPQVPMAGEVGDTISSPWERKLLSSPTRGSLAAKKALVDEVVTKMDSQRAILGISPELKEVSPLFLGEVGTARIAIVAFHSDDSAILVSRIAARDASTDELIAGGGGRFPLNPFFIYSQSVNNSKGSFGGGVALAPHGCDIATSVGGRLLVDGRVDYAWQQDSVDGSFPVPDGTVQRWRVSCGDVVRYEGPELPVHAYDMGAAHAPVPAPGREIDEAAERVAIETNRFLLGRAALSGVPTPVPVWAGSVPALGGRSAIVSASISPAGGVATVLQVGTSGKVLIADGVEVTAPRGSNDVVGPDWNDASLVSTASGASRDLLAVRIPERDGESAIWTSELLVVADRTATEVHAVDATGKLVGTAKLTEGVGTIRIAAPSSVTLQSYNAQRKLLAKSSFHELADAGAIFGAPVISRW
ncbi:hypothetical protein E1258_16705 [Micromonospora sp. KC207]|uniref:hypothetical protein n=1 Tax=Micromonospora sp. KC207 TaxID=2530377 RepID=UPI00104A3D7D|nr:hypothetical protein [Micromonospora sp. KC207]TDC59828.1 hypothetical protein E1258_16705 [Micromonospora sp. KC207]